MSKMPFRIQGENSGNSRLTLSLDHISVTSIPKYYYDVTADDMTPTEVTTRNLTWE
jgi:hypothetical protein